MAVERLEITERKPYADGKSFGDVGPYEVIEGLVHFAVDPLHASNQAITDIELAPRDTDGKVRYTSEFLMLHPTHPERGRHRAIFDVINRGRITALGGLNLAQSYDTSDPLPVGDGFLMRNGYTLVTCGWQPDVPYEPDRFRMNSPEALDSEGQPLTGKIHGWFQAHKPTQLMKLSHNNHTPHPPVDIEEKTASLTVRDHPNSPARPVSRDNWSFVRVEDEQVESELSHIYMPTGFELGKIYELVYTTRGSNVVGLGFAAMRDMISYLKYADESSPFAGDIEYAYAFGVSQSGRFLRDYIYAGMNEDEEGRMSLDGLIPLVAGGMRGDFNIRFGQPSKDICYICPGMFPFTDMEQVDPVTGDRGSLLAVPNNQGKTPKIMFINTSAEYWRGDAALIHTDLENMADAPEDSEHVRRYHFAGAQHGRGTFPPPLERAADLIRGQLPFNILDYGPLTRAVLQNLDRWVTTGEAPPPSRHARFSDNTAVESYTLADTFREVPGVNFPEHVTRAKRLDYGPEVNEGRTTQLPAIEGEEYPAIVSNVNDDRNEVAGIRMPYLTVPVATYTGWNLRHPDSGQAGLVIGITNGLAGWTLPFPATKADREASGDPRLSIEERYESRDAYLQQVRDAGETLAKDGYMLEEDIETVAEKAGLYYDEFMDKGLAALAAD